MKKKFWFFYKLALLGIVIAVFYIVKGNKEYIQFTWYSMFGTFMFFAHLIFGVVEYITRHKPRDMYRVRMRRRSYLLESLMSLGEPDEEKIFTKEYEENFLKYIGVHYLAAPLYIPCIFFVHSFAIIAVSLGILAAPMLIFLFPGFKEVAEHMGGPKRESRKEAKEREKREEQERIEQEKREEMGRWK